MTDNVENTSVRSTDQEVVLMYPDNQLGEPVRKFGDCLQVGEVLKETFFAES